MTATSLRLSIAVTPRQRLVGQQVLITVTATDNTGALIDPTGPALRLVRPDLQVLDVDAEAITLGPAGQGYFAYSLTADVAGLWQIQASCTGPFADAVPSAFDVTQQLGDLAVGGPWLVTSDLDPLVSEKGAILTVTRVTALPAAGTLDGSEPVLIVQGGVAKQGAAGLFAAAAAALVTPADIGAATTDALAAEIARAQGAEATKAPGSLASVALALPSSITAAAHGNAAVVLSGSGALTVDVGSFPAGSSCVVCNETASPVTVTATGFASASIGAPGLGYTAIAAGGEAVFIATSNGAGGVVLRVRGVMA